MKSQKDYLEDILKLSQEHPSAEIKFMASTDVWDDHAYNLQEIRKVMFDVWYCPDDQVYVGEDEIRYQIDYEHEDYKDFTDKDIDIVYEELIKSKDIKEAIIVYLEV